MTSLGLASQMRYYEDQQRCANTDESILCHEYWKKVPTFSWSNISAKKLWFNCRVTVLGALSQEICTVDIIPDFSL